jgi:hypothetical protein
MTYRKRTFSLSEQITALQKKSKKAGLAISEILRRAIDAYLKRR